MLGHIQRLMMDTCFSVVKCKEVIALVFLTAVVSGFKAAFDAFGTTFKQTLDRANSGSGDVAKERLMITLKVDRVQCQAVVTAEQVEAITRDLERVVPEIIRKHTNVSIGETRVALAPAEEGSRAPVIKAEFNLTQNTAQQSEA